MVNEWLTRLQADRYRGADCVLGWSFYSQGSKERATAADEFLDWALAKLGVKLETTSAAAKGEAIAEALMARRALLVLDGVEPLQHGPGPQAGQLKDQGLRALLRRFAAAPPRADHSLIVLTSRLAVADIQRFRNGAAPVVDVEKLSDEAGAELLRDNDVWGVDRDLKRASHDFGGHPLALTLLASLIKETQNGDVRRRDHIRGLLADADNPRHDQARRVMESYEKRMARRTADPARHPPLRRPVRPPGERRLPQGAARQARDPRTDRRDRRPQTTTNGGAPSRACARRGCWRRSTRPILKRSTPIRWCANGSANGSRQTNEAAWKAAHSRLYDHLRRTTREGQSADARRSRPALSRHRPRLPRRAIPGGDCTKSI